VRVRPWVARSAERGVIRLKGSLVLGHRNRGPQVPLVERGERAASQNRKIEPSALTTKYDRIVNIHGASNANYGAGNITGDLFPFNAVSMNTCRYDGAYQRFNPALIVLYAILGSLAQLRN
jgi:hypothetical protein